MTKAVAIVLMCIGSAMIYGVPRDQVTAHVCVEYFTVAAAGGKDSQFSMT